MNSNESLYPAASTVHELIDVVAQTFLHRPAVPLEQPPTQAALDGEEWWTGWITLDGLTHSGVMLMCKKELVMRAAHVWLEEPSPVNEELAHDLLGELTNVVGGNIRSMIPPPPSQEAARLSMPTVLARKAEPPAGGQVVREQWWDCGGEPLLVKVIDFETAPPKDAR